MSHFLLQQAARVIAGSAAPQITSQVASQLTQRFATSSTRDEDRRRFLIWLSGPFKQIDEPAYDTLWHRIHDDQAAIDALTAVFLDLRPSGVQAASDWFRQLAEADQQQFDELLSALQPKQPEPQELLQQAQREAESNVKGAARFLGRAYRRANQSYRDNQSRKR